MPQDLPTPLHFPGVMISSTFTDLTQHRAAVISALNDHELIPIAMENDSAKAVGDIIDSSIEMVRKSSAYIGVISHKYGQVPASSARNPKELSLTELEFDEAQRLNRPILLFVMGEDHPVMRRDVESNAVNNKKLESFRERAKCMSPDSSVHRVYATFQTLEEFRWMVAKSVADLRRFLERQASAGSCVPSQGRVATQQNVGTRLDVKVLLDAIPVAPALYAEPSYIGLHQFVGREAELQRLNHWAAPADMHPVLLFEAIGGTGKSMLTWEWMTNHATAIRKDWAGRFWYSFYEKGAFMADFCRRALAYITGLPLNDFRKKKTGELIQPLLRHLKSQPWLLVLDGLERVLVAYHRFDAAQLADEQAGSTDLIDGRDTCAAIRPEDDDLLRELAAAAPSKLLLTSRLIPSVLLNPSHQPIPGVLHERLPGLLPGDAEALLLSCGIRGTSQEIQGYLTSHCDCHPLVTGVLAGLINDHLPDRGNFDAWCVDPDGGGKLNLADLDLGQKRNNILKFALAALSPEGRELLSTLAILSEPVDSFTLFKLNPNLGPRSKRQSVAETAAGNSGQSPRDLATIVKDLERRGLLQYDPRTKRHDLHPVVRGVAAGRLGRDEMELYGQRVVDHFSQQAHSPYEKAETLDDLRDGLTVVRALLQMNRKTKAFDHYRGGLDHALLFNLEAYSEVLSLLRPFFETGWAALSEKLEAHEAYLANSAAIALRETGELDKAITAFGFSLLASLKQQDWLEVLIRLNNIAASLYGHRPVAVQERCIVFALSLAEIVDDNCELFRARLFRFRQLALIGDWKQAQLVWQLLDQMGRDWPRSRYRPGTAEYIYARSQFWQSQLVEWELERAEQLARQSMNRPTVRALHGLRGEWELDCGRWAQAAESLHEAVRMAREFGKIDAVAEAQLALAKHHLGQLRDPRREAKQITRAKNPPDRALAELWWAIGDHDLATKHALAAYQWAVADGAPYVRRYEVVKTRILLDKLRVPIPDLPRYAPGSLPKLAWEDQVSTAIANLLSRKPPK